METLVEQMRTILGTNFGLYFKAHSFHWNVEGPDFVQYHTFLGDFYTAVWNQTDLIAEKIRMLGSYAPSNLTRILELSDVDESVNIPDAISMLRELSTSNEKMIFHLRAGIVAADAADEPAIGNFLQDLLDAHQKHAWMLKSLIK
jgi:starvation-inducible DNA-binding protein